MVVKVFSGVAEPDMTSKKQRLKVLVKKPTNGLKKPRIVDDASEVGTGVENYMLGTNFRELGVCPLSKQVPKADCGFKKSSETFNRTKVNSTLGLKRRSEEVIKGPVSKRLKLDRSTTILCQAVLKKLMQNPLSAPFEVPVDPVMWNIDDYFDIIKKPMDLGTIKQKLLQHRYDHAEEFEADVRLTFSNAMLYNPPGHYIHQRANTLIRVFDRLWEPVKIKLRGEHEDIRQTHLHKSACPLSSSKFNCDVVARKMIPCDEFTAVKDKHNSTLQKGSFGQDSASMSFMDLERGYASAPSTNGSFGATAPSTSGSFGATAPSTSGSFGATAPSTSGSFGATAPSTNGSFGATAPSTSGSFGATAPSTSGSFGATAPSTSGSFGATAKGLETISDVELSPSRALHIAKLKSRYAETITKAQNHTLLEPGAEADTTNRQKEKEIMHRRQHEEKSNMDAKIRAAKSAARSREESKLKRQRQEAREAARMAIRKIEQSVNVDNNIQVMRDLEALVGTSLVVMCPDRTSRTMWNYKGTNNLRRHLEHLGLYIKEEYSVNYDFDDAFLEEWEGEVL
ncbi:transcription factor GTE11-like isoform X2 [Chenopodium quinoa]|uniref:transcription factor GTE11-like isoform X2 n=1 Tax=Chenopodium quinoa TaxID=63459 RepID=UPI000B77DC75|nr:transcription factor GTE11-like isoform X2 [Chenopodium quinoa]